MEVFSTGGNGTLTIVKEKSPTDFEVEQNLDTTNGPRTITLDGKTGHIFATSQKREPAAAGAAAGGRGLGFAPAFPGLFTILMIGKQGGPVQPLVNESPWCFGPVQVSLTGSTVTFRVNPLFDRSVGNFYTTDGV